eukprot:4984014-Prymnesium_polylepis.1
MCDHLVIHFHPPGTPAVHTLPRTAQECGMHHALHWAEEDITQYPTFGHPPMKSKDTQAHGHGPWIWREGGACGWASCACLRSLRVDGACEQRVEHSG